MAASFAAMASFLSFIPQETGVIWLHVLASLTLIACCSFLDPCLQVFA
jgi:hypothetical protein